MEASLGPVAAKHFQLQEKWENPEVASKRWITQVGQKSRFNPNVVKKNPSAVSSFFFCGASAPPRPVPCRAGKKKKFDHAEKKNRNFKRPFTPRGWLRSGSNLGKTRFRRFPTFDFSTPKNFVWQIFLKKFLAQNQ